MKAVAPDKVDYMLPNKKKQVAFKKHNKNKLRSQNGIRQRLQTEECVMTSSIWGDNNSLNVPKGEWTAEGEVGTRFQNPIAEERRHSDLDM